MEGEKKFRNIVLKSAKHNIPSGRIRNSMVNISTRALQLIEQRDNLRTKDHDPIRLTELNKQIQEEIARYKRDKWREHLDKCNPNSKELWRTIKNLNGGNSREDNSKIEFNDKIAENNSSAAQKFNKMFTPTISIEQSKLKKTAYQDP